MAAIDASALAAYGMAGDFGQAPESLAELLETSRLMKIAPEFLATQPQERRRLYLAKALAANPGLMRFASGGSLNRAIAAANAGAGRDMREAFGALAQSAPETGRNMGGDNEPGMAEPQEREPDGQGEEEDDGEAWDDRTDLDGADFFELAGGDFERARQLEAGPGAAGNDLSDYVLDPFRNFANGWLDLLRGVLGAGKSAADLAGGADSALSRWFGDSLKALGGLEFPVRRPESFGARLAQDVVRNSPQLLSQVGAWLAAGPATAMGLVFTHVYGSDYLKHAEKGIDPLNAALSGALDASLQAAIERAGLHALLTGQGLKELAEQAGRGAARQIAAAAGRGAAIEGATEAAQYAPEYFTSWWAESSLYNNSLSDRAEWTAARALDARNLMQGTRDALYEGLVGAILGAPVAAGHAAWLRRSLDPELAELLEAERNMAQAVVRRLGLEQALNKAREAAAAISDPEQARLVARNSLPENMRAALLSAEDLSAILGRDPRRGQEILDASGADMGRINAALDSGMDLEVDLASLLTAQSPESRLMQESLRLESGGPTLGTARAWSPEARIQDVLRVLNQEDDLEGFSEDERSQAAGEALHSLKSMSGRVRREVRRLEREMREAGLSDLEAESNAALLRAHALTWWRRYGMDGAALLAGLKVEKAGADGHVLDGERRGRQERTPRGQFALGKAGALIRLFQERDVSTVSHESGHMFLQDLMDIGRNGAGRVRQGLVEETARLCGEDLDFAGELARELEDARAGADAEPEALRDYAARLLARSGKEAELARNLMQRERERASAGELDLDPAAAYAQTRADAARRLALQARKAARWLEACQDAGDDLLVFAQHAGLDEAALARALDAALDLDITDPALLEDYVRLQEKTAAAFNSYLAEGRAPSPALAGPLGRFRQWFSALWASLRNSPRVQTSPDLRAAFDRLLASDQEMRVQDGVDAFARNERGFLADKRLSGAQAQGLRALLRRAQANSLNKAQAAARRREEKRLRQRAAELFRELEDDPFWRLAEKGRFREEDIAAILGAGRAAALRAAWPVLFSKKGGSLDEAAAEGGFESAEAMLEQLYERLALRQESRRGAAELMAREELLRAREQSGLPPLPVNPDLEQYLRAAEDAVASIAARMHLENEEEIARWVNNSQVPQTVIDSIAATRLANTSIRRLNAGTLERMLRKVLTERDRLLASGKPGDLMKALNKAGEARVIHAMMQDAARAGRLLEKLRQYGRRIAQAEPGTYPARHAEALRQLLAAFGLGAMRGPADFVESRRAFADILKDIMAEEDLGGSLPAFPDWLQELRHPDSAERNWNGVVQPQFLSPVQLRDLHNLLNFLDKGGRGLSTAAKGAEARLINRAAQSCAEAMRQLPDEPAQRPGGARDFLSNLARKGFAAVDILLWQARKADGLKNIMGKGEMGEFERLWADLIKGEERVRGWLDKVHRAMQPHLRQLDLCRQRLEREYGKNLRLTGIDGQELLAPEAWRKAYKSKYFTAEMIFAMALHSGNPSNLERLLGSFNQEEGNPITPALLYNLFGDTRFRNLKREADPQNLLANTPGLLTPADWRAVQGIWDALALLWPDTRRAHNEMYNFAPEMVPRQSFEISNPDGSAFRLAGGYFPVRYDPRLSDKVASWTEREELLAINEAMFIPPSANRSFTRARVKKAPGLPLRLDMSPIGEHVLNAARFIELARTVRRMDRIHRSPAFRDAYVAKFGREDYESMRPALRGLLRAERLPDVIAWLESKMRRFVVPWGLSLNLNVALIQSTAIFPAMGDLGAAPVLKAMGQLLRHPSLRKDIWKASPYMLSRMQNLDQDLVRQIEFTSGRRPATLRFRGREWSYQDLVDLGMKGIIIVDAAATCAVWLAAYQTRLAELRAQAQSGGQGLQDGQNGLAGSPDQARDGQARRAEEDGQARNQARDDSSPAPDSLILGEREGGAAEDGQPGGAPDGPGIGGNPDRGPARDGAPHSGGLDGRDAGASPRIISPGDAAHERAVLYADTMVKQSNPDFDPSSRSSFLRSRGMMRLFNQFSSAISLFASRNHFMLTAARKDKISRARYARHLAHDFLFPAAFLFLFYGLIRDFHDKRGDPVKSFTGLLFDQFSMAIPIFGTLASDMMQNLLGMGGGNYRRGDIRVSLEAPVELAKHGSQAVNKLAQGRGNSEERKAAIYALLDLASFFMRLPVSKVARKAERGYDQYRRGEGTPASILLPKPGK